ncbi:MAG: S49 family peptidase, partial [Tepidimonas ignava]
MTTSETSPPAPDAARSAPGPTPTAGGAGWERELLEKLALAALQEQRAARRWRNVWRAVWLLMAAVIAWLLYRDVVPPKPASTPHTALVEVRGEIGSESEANAAAIVAALR